MAVFVSAAATHLMKERNLLIDKEGVWDPNQPDVLGSHHQLLQILRPLKRQPGVCPELTEVHVEGEVHELLGELANAEDIEGDTDSDGRPPIIGTHSPVIANLK